MSEHSNGREWKSGICGICPAGCWVEIDTDEDRLVDIRPDTTHPLGMICRRGQHAPEIVHSEHRLRYPMRRVGPKGTLDFARITWDEAFDIIVKQLEDIKAESGPEATAIYTGRGAFELSLCDMFQPEGVAVSSASNVLFPFGSPNTMGVGALCYVSFAMIAPHVTMGRMLVNMFIDMEAADVLVVWGANPATDSPPLDMARLEAAAARGAHVHRDHPADRCRVGAYPTRYGCGPRAEHTGSDDRRGTLRRTVCRRMVPRVRGIADLRPALSSRGRRVDHGRACRHHPLAGTTHLRRHRRVPGDVYGARVLE
jgi:hypothetical protein